MINFLFYAIFISQQPDFGGLSLTPTFHSGKLNSQYGL